MRTAPLAPGWLSPDPGPAGLPVAAVERFRRSAGLLVREVVTRSGETRSSCLVEQASTRGQRPVDSYDLTWLRARCESPGGRGSPVRWADLFAGCGGLSVGVAEAARALDRGGECVFAVEMEPAFADVFAGHFPDATVFRGDIRAAVDRPLGEALSASERVLASAHSGLDLVVGGPPCQGHSNLNNHTRRADPKNALYLRACRFVEICGPEAVVIENVPEVRHDSGRVVWETVGCLERLGYAVSHGVLNGAEVGLPQRRRRHFVLASRRVRPDVDRAREDCAAPVRTVDWAISDLRGLRGETVFDTSSVPSAANQRRMEYLFSEGMYELPDIERPDCHRLRRHTYRSVYGRMRPGEPAPTITAGFGSMGQGRFVHPYDARTITPHEAARLQGFPDFFPFPRNLARSQLQQMIGNAVPPRLGYCVALHLLR